jgi:hypothetical protein
MLGVQYVHLKTLDGSDLYLTRFGIPFWEQLQPENWYARDWFVTHRKRLAGTSTVYRMSSRPVRGRALDLVVKWSRVGEDIPLDTMTIYKFINAEFNSPFEEFALTMELRADGLAPGIRIRTQKPLAIYVPAERLQLWQTGRSEAKVSAKLARHPGVELDILRQYVVLYAWIKGHDAVEMAHELGLEGRAREEFLTRTTCLMTHELEQKGYRVVDMKPQHVILRRTRQGRLLRERNGQLAGALVDYELLVRTPDHEQAQQNAHRRHYLTHMVRRFNVEYLQAMPAHLHPVNILGVDYIHGHAESTGGRLWVAGNDPDLFNYFLPERWRGTHRRYLSLRNQVFLTRTKDNLRFVWKVSHLGELPQHNPTHPRLRDIVGMGYNSPFEEFAHAFALSRRGVRTVYPRAIYRTGHPTRTDHREVADLRRYEQLSHWRTPEGEPLLHPDHEYITIWGFWTGPDERLAENDRELCHPINARQACQARLISEYQLDELLSQARSLLTGNGFEDLNLKGDHLLLSFTRANELVRDAAGHPDIRLCNFELVRRLNSGDKLGS